MSNTSSNNTRIAKNTLLLYFRMLFTMAVSLYNKPYWKKCLSLSFLAILTHQKSLYVYIHLPLSVSMTSKAMRRKW